MATKEREENKTMRKIVRRAGVLLISCVATAAFAVSLPKPTGFVNDYVGMLGDAQKSTLENRLKAFAGEGGPEIAVAIVPSLEGLTVEDYSIQLFKEWHIGKADKNNGVLFLFAPNEKKVRIEVGYGVESFLPDVASKHIISDVVVPKYRAGDKAGAVSAGVNAIITRLGQTSASPAEEQKVNNGEEAVLFFIIFVCIIGAAVFIIFLTPRSNKSKRRWSDYDQNSSLYAPKSPRSSSRRSRDRDSDSGSGFLTGAIIGSALSSDNDSSSRSSSSSSESSSSYSGDSGGGFSGFGGGDSGGGGASGDL